MRKPKPRVKAVVPKVVYSRVFVGVVPACVAVGIAAGCGSSSNTGGNNRQYGVAAVAYQCFDASDPNCRQYGVAAVAYQCFDAGRPVPCYGVAETGFDGGDASDSSDSSRDAPGDGSDSG